MHESRLGRHVIVDFYDCDSAVLDDLEFLKQSFVESAVVANSTVINSIFHQYSPFGVSGVVVIAESDITVHTWPEYGYAAVDVFTCGDQIDPWKAFEYLKSSLRARSYEAREVTRGVFRDGLPVRDMHPFLRSESRVEETS